MQKLWHRILCHRHPAAFQKKFSSKAFAPGVGIPQLNIRTVAVLTLQLPQPSGLVGTKTAILLPPTVVRLVGDSDLLADFAELWAKLRERGCSRTKPTSSRNRGWRGVGIVTELKVRD